MSFTRMYDGKDLYSLHISSIDINIFMAMMVRLIDVDKMPQAEYAQLCNDFPSMFPILEEMLWDWKILKG